MSDWDESTKERIRELVTIETAGAIADRDEMEPEYVRRLVEIRRGIGMDEAATRWLEEIVASMEGHK